MTSKTKSKRNEKAKPKTVEHRKTDK